MIIAQSDYFIIENNEWKTYKIEIESPIKDKNGRDYYCRVSIENNQKDVYGINEIQALILGVQYIKHQLKKFVDENREMYIEKDINSKFDIEISLLSDFSKIPKRPETIRLTPASTL